MRIQGIYCRYTLRFCFYLIVSILLLVLVFYIHNKWSQSFRNYTVPETNKINSVPETNKINSYSHVGEDITKGFYYREQKYQEKPNVHQYPLISKMVESKLQLNYRVHAFYYIWYGNPSHDKSYLHWNHKTMPHWNEEVKKKYPAGVAHTPPDDIGSDYYPRLGCYSSRDTQLIHEHMKQLVKANVGVIVVSWFPPGRSDSNGSSVDDIIPDLLHIAHEHHIKVAFHLEPYSNRNISQIKSDLIYVMDKYSHQPAFYRYGNSGLPLFYVYDSYLLPPNEWGLLLQPDTELSIRNTPYDAIFLGLLVDAKHINDLKYGGFDGVYTYFAANMFSYGSTWKKWPLIIKFCESKGLMFIPSIGPGYMDTSVRPWNGATSRSRDNGGYYRNAWASALTIKPSIVSITSFNEWHEGTQIEEAVPKAGYKDYSPHQPDYYLNMTREFAASWA